VTSAEFRPVAETLREALVEYHHIRRRDLTGPAGTNTLATNSTLVERRGEPLIAMLRERGFATLTGRSVVDLGCGFGSLAALFASKGARVTGVDPNASLFSVGSAAAAAHGLDLEFVKGRMQRLELPSDRFDLAVMNNSLCYVIDPEERLSALGEARRVLKPGGMLIVRDPNAWFPLDQFTGQPLLALRSPGSAWIRAARTGRRRPLVRLVSPRRMRRELVAASFSDIVHEAPVGKLRPRPLNLVARYWHFTARRP
jgi:SAM-dependent methyltransferase